MHPRWLAALGFIGLSTSFACFPPIAVAPIATTYQPTGAIPRPSVAWSVAPYGGYGFPSPQPVSTSPPPGFGRPNPNVSPASYFPARAGLWRYTVSTAPVGGAAIAGERSLALSDVVTTGDTTTATATSNVALQVPGFTAFDETDVKSQVALTSTRFSRTTAGRTSAIPLTASVGDSWTENGLVVRIATYSDTLRLLALGGATFANVLRVEYVAEGASAAPIATVWFAPGIGLVQRIDVFTHEGKTWESRAELSDYPGK